MTLGAESETRKAAGLTADSGDFRVADITIFPKEGAIHSSFEDLSALAGYSKALLSHLPVEVRRRHVVLTNLKSGESREFLDGEMEVRECWSKGSPWFPLQILRQVWRRPDLEVIHLQHEFNQFGGALALPLTLFLLATLRFVARRKIAVTLHEVLALELLDSDFLRQTKVRYPTALVRIVVSIYYRALTRLANVSIVQDPHFAAVLRSDYGLSKEIPVIRIGTDELSPPEKSKARKKLGLGEGGPVLLYFGALDWYKGVDVLVDAVALLPRGRVRLLLAGGQPKRIRHLDDYKSWWRELERRLQGLPEVNLLGFVEDEKLPDLFGSSDLVILPHVVPQRVSAVFNQASSYGLPVIASEVFADQADPVQVFRPTPAELARKILWALDGNLPRLSSCALEFRRSNLWTRSAEELTRIHEKLARA